MLQASSPSEPSFSGARYPYFALYCSNLFLCSEALSFSSKLSSFTSNSLKTSKLEQDNVKPYTPSSKNPYNGRSTSKRHLRQSQLPFTSVSSGGVLKNTSETGAASQKFALTNSTAKTTNSLSFKALNQPSLIDSDCFSIKISDTASKNCRELEKRLAEAKNFNSTDVGIPEG